jgi:hypothetical protein
MRRTTTSIAIRMVLPLQDFSSSTARVQNSSNSQLKVTKCWDGSIVELLAFGPVSKLNFIALIQSDVPRGANIKVGGNDSKQVFDLSFALILQCNLSYDVHCYTLQSVWLSVYRGWNDVCESRINSSVIERHKFRAS